MASINTCNVTGLICDLNGNANSDVQVVATPISAESNQSGQISGEGAGITSSDIEVSTEDDGTFSITLLRNTKVLLWIPSINLRKEIAVPDQAEIDFVSLI